MSTTRKRASKQHITQPEEDTAPLLNRQPARMGDKEEEYHYSWDKTKQIPLRAILLALFLFFIGTVLIVIGALIITKTIVLDHENRGVPFMILGLLCFIPGSYYTFVVYQVANGNPKYSYNDFPEM